MTALTAARESGRKEGGFKSYPMGVDTIYKGGMVGIPIDGYAEALVVGTSKKFAGVAYDTVTCASNGAEYIRVYTEGLFLFVATSITQAMVGQMMYAKDDQTFDDDPTTGIPCGILADYVSATSGWIDIAPGIAYNAIGDHVAKVPFAPSTTTLFDWTNPHPLAIIVRRVILDVTSLTTGADVDLDVNAGSDADGAFDGLGIDSGDAVGVFDSLNATDNGTNGIGKAFKLDENAGTNDQVTGTTTNDCAGAAGYAYIFYTVLPG